MKKILSIVIILSVVLLSFTLPVHATEGTDLVYEIDFSNGSLGDWTAFATSASNLSISTLVYNGVQYGNQTYLKLANIAQKWQSPTLNIYSYIKSKGAGTYHVLINAAQVGNGVYPTQEYTKMMIRGTKVNSFIKYTGGNYLTSISSEHYLFANANLGYDGIEFTAITGSFKVLDTDLIDNNDVFNLCLDGLPIGTDSALYISSVRIVKFDEENITNGKFECGLDGWRSWSDLAYARPTHQGYTDYTGDRTLDVTEFENTSNLFYGRFIRTKTYGGIATNVDQILSFYGPGSYTISLSMRMERLPNTENQSLNFYFSSQNNYHKWLGSETVCESSVWHTINLTFTLSETDYNQLDPENQCVYFRIESPKGTASAYNGSYNNYTAYEIANDVTIYSIREVELSVPIPVEGSSISNFKIYNTDIDEDENFFEINGNNKGIEKSHTTLDDKYLLFNGIIEENEYTLPYGTSPYFDYFENGNDKVSYYISNPSVLTIDNNRNINIHNIGTTDFIIRIGRSNVELSYTIHIAKAVSNFRGYGQIYPGLCWAACGKMLGYHSIANSQGALSLSMNIKLIDIVIDLGYNAYEHPDEDTGQKNEQILVCGTEVAGYLYDAYNINFNYIGYSEIQSFTVESIVQKIDNDVPLVCEFRWNNNGRGHVAIAMGYYKNTDDSYSLLFFDPYLNSNCGGYRSRTYYFLTHQRGLQNHIDEHWTSTHYLAMQ